MPVYERVPCQGVQKKLHPSAYISLIHKVLSARKLRVEAEGIEEVGVVGAVEVCAEEVVAKGFADLFGADADGSAVQALQGADVALEQGAGGLQGSVAFTV